MKGGQSSVEDFVKKAFGTHVYDALNTSKEDSSMLDGQQQSVYMQQEAATSPSVAAWSSSDHYGEYNSGGFGVGASPMNPSMGFNPQNTYGGSVGDMNGIAMNPHVVNFPPNHYLGQQQQSEAFSPGWVSPNYRGRNPRGGRGNGRGNGRGSANFRGSGRGITSSHFGGAFHSSHMGSHMRGGFQSSHSGSSAGISHPDVSRRGMMLQPSEYSSTSTTNPFETFTNQLKSLINNPNIREASFINTVSVSATSILDLVLSSQADFVSFVDQLLMNLWQNLSDFEFLNSAEISMIVSDKQQSEIEKLISDSCIGCIDSFDENDSSSTLRRDFKYNFLKLKRFYKNELLAEFVDQLGLAIRIAELEKNVDGTFNQPVFNFRDVVLEKLIRYNRVYVRDARRLAQRPNCVFDISTPHVSFESSRLEPLLEICHWTYVITHLYKYWGSDDWASLKDVGDVSSSELLKRDGVLANLVLSTLNALLEILTLAVDGEDKLKISIRSYKFHEICETILSSFMLIGNLLEFNELMNDSVEKNDENVSAIINSTAFDTKYSLSDTIHLFKEKVIDSLRNKASGGDSTNKESTADSLESTLSDALEQKMSVKDSKVDMESSIDSIVRKFDSILKYQSTGWNMTVISEFHPEIHNSNVSASSLSPPSLTTILNRIKCTNSEQKSFEINKHLKKSKDIMEERADVKSCLMKFFDECYALKMMSNSENETESRNKVESNPSTPRSPSSTTVLLYSEVFREDDSTRGGENNKSLSSYYSRVKTLPSTHCIASTAAPKVLTKVKTTPVKTEERKSDANLAAVEVSTKSASNIKQDKAPNATRTSSDSSSKNGELSIEEQNFLDEMLAKEDDSTSEQESISGHASMDEEAAHCFQSFLKSLPEEK